MDVIKCACKGRCPSTFVNIVCQMHRWDNFVFIILFKCKFNHSCCKVGDFLEFILNLTELFAFLYTTKYTKFAVETCDFFSIQIKSEQSIFFVM